MFGLEQPLMSRLAVAVALVAAAPAAMAAETASWATATGSADVRDHVTPEEAKRKALNQARAEAIRKAAGLTVNDQFLEVTTQRNQRASEFVMQEISTLAEGVILEEQLSWSMKQLPVIAGELPVSRITVSGRFKVAKLPGPDLSFVARLGLSRATLVEGDPLTLTVSASEPAHLLVFNLAADDRVYLLYPNRFTPALKVERGQELRLPGPEDAFVLQPRPVAGHAADTEVVRVIASRERIAPPPVDQRGTLSVRDFYQWLYRLPRRAWTDAEATYTVHAE